jgi:hypothetical protein
MRKLLNTLYVTIPNAYLSKDGETVLVRVEHDLGGHPKAATYDQFKTGHSEGLRHTH